MSFNEIFIAVAVRCRGGGRGWFLGVCRAVMSCVISSCLFYELLCISVVQPGLLSPPSIIQSVH